MSMIAAEVSFMKAVIRGWWECVCGDCFANQVSGGVPLVIAAYNSFMRVWSRE